MTDHRPTLKTLSFYASEQLILRAETVLQVEQIHFYHKPFSDNISVCVTALKNKNLEVPYFDTRVPLIQQISLAKGDTLTFRLHTPVCVTIGVTAQVFPLHECGWFWISKVAE